MPKLKDYFASDLATFVNTDEHAEIHDIDGVDMPAVVDDDILKERPRASLERSPYSDGIYVGNFVVFVKLSDLGYRPAIGQYLRFDGKLHIVTDCTESTGLLEITLEANRA